MILDTIDNFSTYVAMHPHFTDVLAIVRRDGLGAFPLGRSDINDAGAFVLVSEYETRAEAEGFIECHKRFIDIQILLKGNARVGIAPAAECSVTQAYDAEKDFMKLGGAVEYFGLLPGKFAVFFPQDGHMPNVTAGEKPVGVKKIVFKIPVLK